MLVYVDGLEKENPETPIIYRVDRIRDLEVLEEHFQIPYSEKFQEQGFRNAADVGRRIEETEILV